MNGSEMRLTQQPHQHPDVYFQGRETVNKYYLATPAIVEETMRKFEKIVGRKYNLFDYVGAPDAEKIVIIMGSGSETVHETVEYLVSKGQKVGVIKIRLFRPFSNRHFMAAIPKTVKKIAVLDRTKEPGSLGEPLYLDVRTGIGEAMSDKYAPFKDYPLVVGGRYGLGSKDMVFPRHHRAQEGGGKYKAHGDGGKRLERRDHDTGLRGTDHRLEPRR